MCSWLSRIRWCFTSQLAQKPKLLMIQPASLDAPWILANWHHLWGLELHSPENQNQILSKMHGHKWGLDPCRPKYLSCWFSLRWQRHLFLPTQREGRSPSKRCWSTIFLKIQFVFQQTRQSWLPPFQRCTDKNRVNNVSLGPHLHNIQKSKTNVNIFNLFLALERKRDTGPRVATQWRNLRTQHKCSKKGVTIFLIKQYEM